MASASTSFGNIAGVHKAIFKKLFICFQSQDQLTEKACDIFFYKLFKKTNIYSLFTFKCSFFEDYNTFLK